MKSKQKLVYHFAANSAEGSAEMKSLLGGKGANLAEMCRLGLPVPPGFTISTDVCTYYYKHHSSYPKSLEAEVLENIRRIESEIGKTFGDPENPLLFSVRSGARASMPGMMDTVLNLGMNDKIVVGIANLSKNPRFAWDNYRRFVQMYGDVVLGLQPINPNDADPFEEIIDKLKAEKRIELDTDLSVDDLKFLVQEFKYVIKARTGKEFPTDPMKQLWGAISAVFGTHAKTININSTKSMTGHLLGAAGAIEAISSVLAIQNGIIPPTINHTVVDESINPELNLTLNNAQKRDIKVAMSNTFGFGGHNACVLFKKIEN